MTNKLPLQESLEQAKRLSLAGEYHEAHHIVDELLNDNPDNLDVLRLKGNILDLEYASKEDVSLPPSRYYYEKILTIDSENTLALIDLGDYWLNAEAYEKSLHYYDKAISLLEHDKFCLSKADELEEARNGKSEALRQLAEKQSQKRQ